MREFSVLVRREAGLEDQWVAHCLNWDLVSQGDSPAHAIQMVHEAIHIAIAEDVSDGFDPSERHSAPKALWELFARIQQVGTRISSADVDNFALSIGRPVCFAVVMYLLQACDAKSDDIADSAPPPFMIAEFQRSDRRATC